MAALREFMFERVYLGPVATREHVKIDLVIGLLFSHYCAHPDEIPDSIPDGELSVRVTDYLAGMTDRFCIRAFEAAVGAGGVRAVTTLRRRLARPRVRCGRHGQRCVAARGIDLRRAGVNSYFGNCPFHDERTDSFHVSPDEQALPLLRLPGSPAIAFNFVMETEGVDFKGALESLAARFGVALETRDENPEAAARRRRLDRLTDLLDRTATFYARFLWESSEAMPARYYLLGRGLTEETLREFRVGYSPGRVGADPDGVAREWLQRRGAAGGGAGGALAAAPRQRV